MTASQLGRALGNWNDRHSRHDTASEATWRWRILDRIAGSLYRRGDRRR
jgi:hypothetical protein